jgi:hypothetical protein
MICSMFPNSEALARRAAALRERAEAARPESWRPDKPELEHPNPLVGVLERVVDGPDRGYGPTKIAELRDVDGRRSWAVWLLGHVLRSEFLERASAPQPGELVAIRYEGRKRRQFARVGDPSEYESYRVVVDRSERQNAAEKPMQAVDDDEIPF